MTRSAIRVLAGDIGGTNARLAIVGIDGPAAHVLREAQYRSADFSGLTPIVERFCEENGESPERAVCGVAGRVAGGTAQLPNLGWTVTEAELAAATGASRAAVINDFDATGHGLALLTASDLVVLQQGIRVPDGAIALIGPGTGLGEGMLLWDGARYRVYPSEGGHASFAPQNDLEWGLSRFLAAEFGEVSFERVLSGPGLVRTYRYLVATGYAPERADVSSEMVRGDPAAVVAGHGLAEDDAICAKALDVFVSVLGSKAGDLALTVYATGGVYVAGGIAPRIIARLQHGPFLGSFHRKGRLSEFMARLPVRVIMNPSVGLLGAAAVAASLP
ncbi:MAG TPA: glucokinase [Gemmatimonadales bacterium]|nr:glucokinase [Gemmatimonadales bacterium]